MSPHFIKRCKDVVVYENTSDAGPLNPITAYDCMHKGVVQASWKFINSHKQTDSSHVVRKQVPKQNLLSALVLHTIIHPVQYQH